MCIFDEAAGGEREHCSSENQAILVFVFVCCTTLRILVSCPYAFQTQEVSFRCEPSSKTGQLACRTNDTVARNNDSNRVSTVCRSDCPTGRPISESLGEASIRSGFPKWDAQQCFPNLFLKGRTTHIQRNREDVPRSLEIFVQFFFSPNEYRMKGLVHDMTDANASRVVLLPKNRD